MFFVIGVISLAAVTEQKLGGLMIELIGEAGEAGHQAADFADHVGQLA